MSGLKMRIILIAGAASQMLENQHFWEKKNDIERPKARPLDREKKVDFSL